MNKLLLLPLIASSLLYGATPGMKLYGKYCVECHGDDGKDTSIAPKPISGSGGTLAKLTGYKNGTYGGDQKETMRSNVSELSDENLKLVSDYVDSL